MRDFNKDAAKWDENPGRVKMANEIADAIIDTLKPSSDMDILEYGCGTGLVSMRLQPLVHSVTGIDTSEGMLDAFQNKIDSADIENVQIVYLDPQSEPVIYGSYHAIIISMTLHHIPEIAPLLTQFADSLHRGCKLCIADLDSDNGLFHDDNTGVYHNGFDREQLKETLISCGFTNVDVRTATTIAKPNSDGIMRTFPIFLMTGQKM